MVGGRGPCLGSRALAASALPSLASATADASVESRDLRWATLRVDPTAFGLCLARSTAACSTAGLIRPAGQKPSSSASAAPLSSGALPFAWSKQSYKVQIPCCPWPDGGTNNSIMLPRCTGPL